MTRRTNRHTDAYYQKKYAEKREFYDYAIGLYQRFGATQHELKEITKCYVEMDVIRTEAMISNGLELPEVQWIDVAVY